MLAFLYLLCYDIRELKKKGEKDMLTAVYFILFALGFTTLVSNLPEEHMKENISGYWWLCGLGIFVGVLVFLFEANLYMGGF